MTRDSPIRSARIGGQPGTEPAVPPLDRDRQVERPAECLRRERLADRSGRDEPPAAEHERVREARRDLLDVVGDENEAARRGPAGEPAQIADERLAELYASADIFVLPSRFEGYGMAFAEAIAHGLPVIGTTAGALPGTIPPATGILVAPDDVSALAAALRRLIENPAERQQLSAAAHQAARDLPTWEDAARLFASVIEGVA